jgi:hypothetical protein
MDRMLTRITGVSTEYLLLPKVYTQAQFRHLQQTHHPRIRRHTENPGLTYD